MSGGRSPLVTEIESLLRGEAPSAVRVEQAIGAMLDGDATDAQIGAWLIALRARGETSDALLGGARALLARADKSVTLGPAVDTCGTGGDGAGSLNISTLAAIALAAAGVPVAKHGNRSVSSKTGSADFVAALGIDLEAPAANLMTAFDEVGLAFLFAPRFHPTLRRVAGLRRELGTRTLFNLLGPLVNPAEAPVRVVGVFNRQWLRPMAEALAALHVEQAVVLCGEGNLDEPSPEGPTEVVWVRDGRLQAAVLTPSDFGLSPAPLAHLRGGEVADNLSAGLRLLGGEQSLRGARHAILMTAALGLHLYQRVELGEATRRIAATLDNGRALQVVDKWRTWLPRSAT